jgi:OFA family oxalate/formate antiporter-like MFS transporter
VRLSERSLDELIARLASGIMAAGFGGGTALFIPIISSLLKSDGDQKTFLVSGLVQGLVIVFVAQFLRHPAAETLTVSKAAAPAGGSQIGRHHFTTPEMLRTPQFYWMYVMFVLMATGGLLVTANACFRASSVGAADTCPREVIEKPATPFVQKPCA